MYSSQQHLGHSTELIRKPCLIEALIASNTDSCVTVNKYVQLYMDAVYHMNDMWIISV